MRHSIKLAENYQLGKRSLKMADEFEVFFKMRQEKCLNSRKEL